MLRRELAISLRAPVTWIQAALSALLAGHGFILALDLFSAASRSVRGAALMAREMDPLLGMVRPTVGGLYVAVSLLGPLVAARPLSVEKERRTLHPLLLRAGSAGRVLAPKLLASLVAVALQLTAPAALMLLWLGAGGHLGMAETAAAFAGHALDLVLVCAVATAAAAWARTLAQAVALALVLIATSWAIDASEGFAALAWLGRALDWSVTTHLLPFERGTPSAGAALWFLAASSGAVALAWVGLRTDLAPGRRAGLAALVVVAAALLCSACARVRSAADWTEQRRFSLPPAAARELRMLPGPLRVTVELDRDDARRQQLESDTLSRLRLARPDLEIATPRDDRPAPAEGERDETYGTLELCAGAECRSTRSTSRRELVTLLFEAAHRAPPDFTQPEYSGYPLVVEGGTRAALAGAAYLGLPASLLIIGWLATRSPRRTSWNESSPR